VLKGTGEDLKLRIVFDCSAVDVNGNSLNSTMLDAPVPEADILRILTGFRQHPFAFTADIKSCFLQIRLHPDQVDKFRFLWRDNAQKDPEIYRFTSIIFGSKCSPWISSTCIFEVLKYFQDKYPALVEKSLRSLWVDDFGFSMPTLAAAKQDRRLLEDMLETASFHLSKYAASHEEILEGVPQTERIFPSGVEKGITKILGQPWDIQRDELLPNGELVPKILKLLSLKATRRVVARGVASVFDPLGFLAPWVLVGKLLLRDVWENQKKTAEEKGISATAKKLWDIPLLPEYEERFRNWGKQIPQLNGISLPRCLVTQKKLSRQVLHVFCDASPSAMCTAAYLVTHYVDRSVTSRFICSKTKTAPAKGLTLPRAELVAALMGVRLGDKLLEHLEMEKEAAERHFWTDSTVALHWIKKDSSNWKPYVANRVREIQKLSDKILWKHVPTHLNAADVGTRGQTLEELKNKKLWYEGPSFLLEGCWPEQPGVLEATPEVKEEEKSSQMETNLISLAATKYEHPIALVLKVCSSFIGILRTISWMLKLKFPTDELYITQAELNRALGKLLKYTQEESFPKEIQTLEKGETLVQGHNLANLDPFLDEQGALRVRGRQAISQDLTYGQKHPLILPKKNPVVRMMILHVHECNNHAGADWCLRYLRRDYWIIRGRHEVLAALADCMVCKKMAGRMVVQKMAPLPRERAAFREPVFTNQAIDELGPLLILDDQGEESKVWILVIACMTFRAVHLEVLRDLSYESLMLALRRTFALYGIPKYVRLDSFPTHLKVQREFGMVERELSPVEIREKSKIFGIKWSWSSKYQPSTNGIIERLVGVTKKALQKSLTKEILTYDQLLTLVAEVKRMINNRTLVRSYMEPDEHVHPICPNDLIYGHPLYSLPYEVRPDKAGEAEDLQAGWENRTRILNSFQTVFMDQWIKNLLENQKWKDVRDNIKKGDLVLLNLPTKKRQGWPVGVVEEVLKSRDNLVRSCVLRIHKPKKRDSLAPQSKLITRSVRSLVLLRNLYPEQEASVGEEMQDRSAPVHQPELPEEEGVELEDGE